MLSLSRFILLLAVAGMAVTACQQKPTKVYHSQTLDSQNLVRSLSRPVTVDQKTVILDARSSLDYGLSHIVNSHNIRWDLFSEQGSHPGHLIDPFKITLRLSNYGIKKNSKLVVVGEHDRWEAGRLAWMLMYMGFKEVQAVDIDALNLSRSNLLVAKQSAKGWTPKLNDTLKANKKEVLEIISQGRSKEVHLIDVRSEKEFLKPVKVVSNYALPQPPSINIHWEEFFNEQGRPHKAIVRKLRDIGIDRHHRIVLISDKGLRSAAATYALTMLGYSLAANFNSGWAQVSR